MTAVALASPRRRSPKSYDRVAEPGPLSEEGEALFQTLRELRKSIADRQSVPAYVVFSDKTLRAMAEARPSTPQEFLAVSGVGPLKLERYGEAFMEAVSRGLTDPMTTEVGGQAGAAPFTAEAGELAGAPPLAAEADEQAGTPPLAADADA